MSAVFSALLQSWRSLLIAAMAAAMLLAVAKGPSAMPGEDPACDESLAEWAESIPSDYIEVLSWNIQKASRDGWRDDLARLGEGVHLAFIQEADLAAPLVETLDSTHYRSFAEGYATTQKTTGVMTLSAAAPGFECRYQSIEPWLGTPKATSVTYHAISDRPERLLAVNLHAVNFALGTKEYREQIDAVKFLISTHTGPIIVAGDLNTWSAARQRLVDEFMSEHGLAPVAFSPDLRTRIFGRVLDHVYIRGLAAEQAEVIIVTTSDHNALRMRLKFQD